MLPNGDVLQKLEVNNTEGGHSGHHVKKPTIHDSKQASQIEKSRLITRNGQVIRYMADGNFQNLFPSGTVTTQDKRKGIWTTVNTKGVRRIRKLRDN